jgi:TM2 domain-containing membrane protein YozV
LAWTNWIAGIIAVYTTLFGLGKLVFGQIGTGLILLAIAVVAFAWIARSFRSDRMAAESVAQSATAVPAD